MSIEEAWNLPISAEMSSRQQQQNNTQPNRTHSQQFVQKNYGQVGRKTIKRKSKRPVVIRITEGRLIRLPPLSNNTTLRILAHENNFTFIVNKKRN